MPSLYILNQYIKNLEFFILIIYSIPLSGIVESELLRFYSCMKKIGLIGYGWLGSRVSRSFSDSFEIYTTTTSPEKLQDIRSEGIHADLVVFSEYEKEFPDEWSIAADLDVMIITVPFSEKRTPHDTLKKRLAKLISFIGKFEKQVFFMSSTGVYSDKPEVFTEEMLPSEDVFVESMVKKAFPQVNILRLGGLMGDERLLKNFNVSNLSGVVNHIHYKDVAAVIKTIINKEIKGKEYNVAAPLHPSKQAVIAAQNNHVADDTEHIGKQRIISSEKLISELNYTFIYPDPTTFHLDEN